MDEPNNEIQMRDTGLGGLEARKGRVGIVCGGYKAMIKRL
jgi:hypothetical protein